MAFYINLNSGIDNFLSNHNHDHHHDLIQKLKRQNPEHFQHLVKMHLSFALEINLNELDECDERKFRISRWAFPFPRRDKTLKESSKFNDCEASAITDNVATQIYQIITFLNQEKNISEEGIFRISGAISRQKQLINYLKNGTPIDLNNNQFTVHDCATVLKTYLSNLSEPLITDAYYPTYCHIAELCKHSEETVKTKILDSLRLMMLLLPYENAVILRHVILLLHSAANYASKNKMSAENLATLFTPHLLCLRKFSGEALHTNTQLLWDIAVFMIQSGPDLFEVPSSLLADVKLYWFEKNRRQLSPKNNMMDETTTDSGLVNTVLSFVDREKTAQENTTNTTETALAQLYAYIQSLPESSKKRRLIKQFNKENGQGTPRKFLVNEDRSRLKKRNLDSLKKHILFNKGNKQINKTNCELDEPNENTEPKIKASHKLKFKEKTLDCRECGCSDTSSDEYAVKSNDNELVIPLEGNAEFVISPEGNDVFCISEKTETTEQKVDEKDEKNNDVLVATTIDEDDKEVVEMSEMPPCRQHFLTPIIRRNSQLLQCRQHLKNISSCPNLTSSLSNIGTTTSTPASYFNNVPMTPPFSAINEDMSPITMSAKKMPKAMQEIMMTPRSRNPVISNSVGSNSSPAVSSSDDDNNKYDKANSRTGSYSSLVTSEDFDESSKFIPSDLSSGQEVLSKTFQDYLLSRSMRTDPSFSSRASDFSANDEKLSESLLYCLDGNIPDVEKNSFTKKNVNETAL